MSDGFNVTIGNVRLGGPFSFGAAPAQPQTVPLQPFDLFATRIWQIKLPVDAATLDGWIKPIEALRAAHPEPAGRTNRGGWNSPGHDLLDDPAFTALRGHITGAINTALGQMGLDGMAFSLQSWANIHDRGGFNFAHMHEGCLLSGTFYLAVPAGSGKLVFRDPRPGLQHGFLKGAGANAYRDIDLRPEAGLLVLFPYWLEHYVEVHQGEAPRVAIAFNAIR